jgi:hypothetical protein
MSSCREGMGARTAGATTRVACPLEFRSRFGGPVPEGLRRSSRIDDRTVRARKGRRVRGGARRDSRRSTVGRGRARRAVQRGGNTVPNARPTPFMTRGKPARTAPPRSERATYPSISSSTDAADSSGRPWGARSGTEGAVPDTSRPLLDGHGRTDRVRYGAGYRAPGRTHDPVRARTPSREGRPSQGGMGWGRPAVAGLPVPPKLLPADRHRLCGTIHNDGAERGVRSVARDRGDYERVGAVGLVERHRAPGRRLRVAVDHHAPGSAGG